MESPKIREYAKFQSMMDDKEKNKVINKIIKSGKLDSNTLAILSPDLSDEPKKWKFINNYVKGSVNVSDYKKDGG